MLFIRWWNYLAICCIFFPRWYCFAFWCKKIMSPESDSSMSTLLICFPKTFRKRGFQNDEKGPWNRKRSLWSYGLNISWFWAFISLKLSVRGRFSKNTPRRLPLCKNKAERAQGGELFPEVCCLCCLGYIILQSEGGSFLLGILRFSLKRMINCYCATCSGKGR